MRLLNIALLGAVATATSGSAWSGPLTAVTILQGFNAVIYGDAATPSDIEAAAVIGGNFSGATIYNNPASTPPAGFGALTVYGGTSATRSTSTMAAARPSAAQALRRSTSTAAAVISPPPAIRSPISWRR